MQSLLGELNWNAFAIAVLNCTVQEEYVLVNAASYFMFAGSEHMSQLWFSNAFDNGEHLF